MDDLATESITPETDLELNESTEEVEDLALEGEQSEESPDAEEEVIELLDLDGEEVELGTIRQWREEAKASKDERMMKADYTRKTMAVADERKALKARADSLEQVIEDLSQDLLEDFDPKALEELRDYDPSAYLKKKEALDARKAKIAAAKSRAAKVREELSEEDAKVERDELVRANPQWLDATGKPTKQYETDIAAMNGYLVEKGWTPEQIAKVDSARVWLVIKDAAGQKAERAKGESIKQKVKKAPVVTKPRSNSAPTKQKSHAEILYGA